LFRSAAGLDLNFAGGVFSLNNTRTDSPANIPGWSFSRTDTNGTATALDLAGNVIQFATGVPRITNRGILVEEARTNSVTNSSMIGAVVGSPGTFPTTWTGANWTVAGTGTENGLPYIDARYVGTPSGTQFLNFGANPAASAGQAWTASVYTRLVAGSLTNVTALQLTAASTGGTTASANQTVSTATLEPAVRSTVTVTAGTGATGATSYIRMTGSGAVDFTIRLYAPQLELGAFATSPIITTGAAGTRGADAGRITQSPTASGTIIATVRIPTDKNNRRVVGTNGASAVTPLAYSTAGIETYNGSSTLGKTISMTAGALVTVGVTWESGRRSVTGAGLTVATDANAIGSFTEMWFGQDDSLAAGNALNESIARVQVLPYAVTDAQLQALTAP
jgi:hypothetical protein